MPGDPQDVRATPINSSSIHVVWKPPKSKDQNGVIRGYHIHIQEVSEKVGKISFSLFSQVETNKNFTKFLLIQKIVFNIFINKFLN